MTDQEGAAMTPDIVTEARRLLDAATPIGDDAPGYYVTEDGRVLSTTGWRGSTVRELVQAPDQDGYLRVRVTLPSGRRVRAFVHRLVARAYHGPCPPGHQCRHLNGDKTDNRAANLAWGTAAQNAADRNRHGSTVRGERSPNTPLTEQDVRTIRSMLRDGWTQRAVAGAYGVHQGTVHKIATRKSWAHLTDDGGQS